MQLTRKTLSGLVLCLGLVATGCGKNSTSDNAAPSKAVASSPAPKTIVDTAVAAGSFKTLVTALTQADLVATLQGSGPFTVFAPTDDAFAKVPAATLQALLADKAALRKVLTYHVIAGNLGSKEVLASTQLTTLEGQPVSISVRDGQPYVNDSRITAVDVGASNGVIHVIDTVLLPPAK